MCECLIDGGGLDLTDDDLHVIRNVEACELCDGHRALTDDLCVQCAVDEHGLADLVLLLVVQEVAAAADHLRLDSVVNVLVRDDRLLGCADHAVVEGLGEDDGIDRIQNIRALVDDSGCVAGADADCRGTGGIRCLDHAGAAGCEDDVSFLHDHVGQFEGGNVHPANQTLGSACLLGSLHDDLCCGDGGFLGTRVRGNDNAVARLESEQALENSGRGRVGGRDNCRDHADGLCELHDAELLVLLDHAAGFHVLIVVVDMLSRIVILDDLVLDDTHAGLLDCHLGKRDTCVVGSECCCLEDGIHLLLRVGRILCLRLADLGELHLQRLGAGNENGLRSLIFFVHVISPILAMLRSRNLRGLCAYVLDVSLIDRVRNSIVSHCYFFVNGFGNFHVTKQMQNTSAEFGSFDESPCTFRGSVV